MRSQREGRSPSFAASFRIQEATSGEASTVNFWRLTRLMRVRRGEGMRSSRKPDPSR